MTKEEQLKKFEEIRNLSVKVLKDYFGNCSESITESPYGGVTTYVLDTELPSRESITDDDRILRLVADAIRKISPSTIIGERILCNHNYLRDKKSIFTILSKGGRDHLIVYLPENNFLQHLWLENIIYMIPNIFELMYYEYRFQYHCAESIKNSMKYATRSFDQEVLSDE